MKVDRLLQRAFVAVPVGLGSLSSQAAAVRAAGGHFDHFAPWQYAFALGLGAIASLPAGSGPLGILTAPADGEKSLAQSLGASVHSLLSAPARAKAAREQRRWQAIQESIRRDAVKIAGEMVRTGEFVMTPLGLAPAHPKADTKADTPVTAPVTAPAVPINGQPLPMPAPGYGYDAPGSATAAAAPAAPPGVLSGADAQDAFGGANGPAADDKPPVRYTIG